MEKSTRDIATILKEKDAEKYKVIIERAATDAYHDFKHMDVPEHPEYAEWDPKIQLVDDLSVFPELAELRDRVINGEFDEKADAEDVRRMRQDMLNVGFTDEQFVTLSFAPPTHEERRTGIAQ